MRYIKIRGNNYNEVMMKLKMDYGDDAIPISHKFVKEGGLFNSKLFAREVVELTAAVQERKFKSSILGEKKKIDFTVDDPVEKTAAEPRKSRLSDILDRAPAPSGSAASSRAAAEKRAAGFNFNEKLNEVYAGIADQKKAAPLPAQEPDPEPVRAPEIESEEPVKRAEAEAPAAGSGVRFEKELDEIKRAIFKMTTERTVAAEAFSGEDVNIRPLREALRNNDYDDEQCSGDTVTK